MQTEQSSHMIATCRWDSSIDLPAQAHALQDFISGWSHSVLLNELELCFSALCPRGQTWRIDTLEVDLGDIPLDQLAQELPKRLRARLQWAIADLQAVQAQDSAPAPLRILDDGALRHEFVASYLRGGVVPWWWQGAGSATRLLERQLGERAPETAALLRELGREEYVRRRLVWQLDETQLRRVVHVLEPWHGDVICAYADHLFAMQATRQAPAVAAADFRHGAWLDILTYLLVDRGTLFNTMAFVRASLERTAQRYRLPVHALLEYMQAAVLALAPHGVVAGTFVSAIRALHARECGRPAPLPAPRVQDDLWQRLQGLLRHGAGRSVAGGDTVYLGELFALLAGQDAPRMARLLRGEGRARSVRNAILRHFDSAGLALLVRVLEPQEHAFIVEHVAHTQALAERQRWSGPVVWQVLLAYLLVERGSHFSRRQLVHDTLLQMCRQHGCDYARFLDLLIHAVEVQHPHRHRFELLAILRELQAPLPVADQRRADALHCLKTGGHGGAAGTPRAALREWLLARPPMQWLCATELRGVDDAVLCRRLLALAGPAGMPRLLDALAPGAGVFICGLAALLARRRAWLPGLDRIDPALQLPALMLQALPGFRRRLGAAFAARLFWRNFMALLARHGVDSAALQRQLHACLGESGAPPHEAMLSGWLLPLLEETPCALPCAEPVTADGTPAPLFDVLRRAMAAPLPPATLDAAVTQGWRASGGGAVVTRWLARQPDQYRLLQALARLRHVPEIGNWLLEQLPDELNPPEDTLRDWSAMLRAGGCWQGADAVLERHLLDIFWETAFDAGAQGSGSAQLLATMALRACQRLHIGVADCMAGWRAHLPQLRHPHWRRAYAAMPDSARAAAVGQEVPGRYPDVLPDASPGARQGAHGQPTAAGRDAANGPLRQDQLARYLDHPGLYATLRHALLHGVTPARTPEAPAVDLPRLLFDVLAWRPAQAPALLAGVWRQPEAMHRLLAIVPFGWLSAAMAAAAPARRGTVQALVQLQRWLDGLSLPGASRRQRQAILLELALRGWLANDWVALQPERFARALLWQLACRHQVQPDAVRRACAPGLAGVPPALRQALVEMLEEPGQPGHARQPHPANRPAKHPANRLAVPGLPLRVSNAGLVILQGFMAPLLERLGLTQGGRFVDGSVQRYAVHCLQFLATGCEQTPEIQLMLNKVLCGLPLHEPVEGGIALQPDQRATCDSLLTAMLGHWGACGSTSADGFRGNWLVRDGSLTEMKDRWDLIVERRAYDVLLARAPFSYSVIKLPWMEKAIYVTWPT
jgi:hypothetical protein